MLSDLFSGWIPGFSVLVSTTEASFVIDGVIGGMAHVCGAVEEAQLGLENNDLVLQLRWRQAVHENGSLVWRLANYRQTDGHDVGGLT